jgi:hypothetical protein
LARADGHWLRLDSDGINHCKPVDNIRQEQNNSIMIFPLYKPLPHRL